MNIILRLYYIFCTSASINENNELNQLNKETKVSDNTEIAFMNFNEKKLESTSKDTSIKEELLMNYIIKLSMNITNDNYYYIDTLLNIQNIVEFCNIQINNNINELIVSNEFIYLFSFLEHDIINALKGLKFFNIGNEDINKIILKLDQWQSYQYKIPIFINALQELLNLDFKIDSYLNSERCNYFISILYTCHKNVNLSNNSLNEKIQYKLKLLRKNINIHFELNEMLKYLINTTNKLSDKHIKNYFVYGLQNLFLCDTYTTMPRYFNILILIYIFKNEKQYFNVDWYTKLFYMLSIEKDRVKYHKFKKRIFKDISDTDKFIFFELYIIMNSTDIKKSLEYLRMLKNNEKQLKLLYNLIVLVNVVKSKIYGLGSQK